MHRQLFRSRRNRVLLGLCGGIGEYLNMDPVLIRIIWLFLPGLNIIVYFIGALIVPAEY